MINISKEYKQVNKKLENSINEKKNLRRALEGREKELAVAERQVSLLQKALQETKAIETNESAQQGSNREALSTLANALKSLQNKFSLKEKEYDELFAKYNDVKNAVDEEAAYNKALKNALNMKANEVGMQFCCLLSVCCLSCNQLGLQGDGQGGILEEVIKQKDTIRRLQKENEQLSQQLEANLRNQELQDIQHQSEEFLRLKQVYRDYRCIEDVILSIQSITRLEKEKNAVSFMPQLTACHDDPMKLLDHIDYIDNDNVMLESFYVTAETMINALAHQMSKIAKHARGTNTVIYRTASSDLLPKR
eukprot:766680-Hanusia_phi.AAC.6